MTNDRIYDEAAAWLVRQQGDAVDWDAFTAWLEADPRHRTAYDELALIDAGLDEHAARLSDALPPQELVPDNDTQPRRWGRWAGFSGGAVAAAIGLFLLFQPLNQVPVQDYRSAPGKSLQVALSDGAHVVLAPISHLRVRGDDIALEGTGYFDVPHWPGRTLTITAGEFKVSDIGTRFSVGNEQDGVSVDVADGKLAVSSAGLRQPITLSSGHGLFADRSKGTVRLIKVDPQQVASWRRGQLQFDQTPLALVARDISRYSGVTVTVDPAIAKQPFSGVIAIDHGDAPARTLAQILSLDVKTVGGTARLEPRRR